MRIGAQQPRVRRAPPYVSTHGDEVIDFMSQIGRPLDEWQAQIILDAFGVREDGMWSAFELLVLVARQNGKGGVTEAIELGGLFLFREPLILHSAHQFKTSTSAFRRLQDIIEGSDWLSRRVKMISRSKGDESIELTRAAGGGRLQFVARTLGSGRGLTGSKNIFDEAYALTVGQYAAQTPTLSTIPNPQIIYTSTPPDEETGPLPEDAMLPSVRRRGHAGGERTAIYEWSPPAKFDRTDPEMWYRCNPALGIRIQPWFLQQQLDAFTDAGRPEKFDVEHLGLYNDDASAQWQYVPESAWVQAEDPDSHREGDIALAITMSEDRQWTSISICGPTGDGLRHVEVAVSARGSGWVVAKVVEMRDRLWPCAIAIRPSGPEGSLISDLEAAGLELTKMIVQDVAQACGMLRDGIAGPEAGQDADVDLEASPRNVRHRGQQVLTIAIAGAVTRRAGGAQIWDQAAAVVDISPAIGVGNALWAYAKFGQAGNPWGGIL